MNYFMVDRDGCIVQHGYVPDGCYTVGQAFDSGRLTCLEGDVPTGATHYINNRFVTKVSKQHLESEARLRRYNLLNGCDWTQLPDIPQAITDKWQPYRQALRDITKQPGFPENIQWPEPPQ